MCVRALALINTLYVLGALYGERRTVTQSFIIIIILKLRTKMALPLGRWRSFFDGHAQFQLLFYFFCFRLRLCLEAVGSIVIRSAINMNFGFYCNVGRI